MCKKTLLAQLWAGIEIASKVSWIPILIVSSFGLYYNCGSYDIQSRGDRADVKTTAWDMGSNNDPANSNLLVWRHDYLDKGKRGRNST
jgi:hypothetical protein